MWSVEVHEDPIPVLRILMACDAWGRGHLFQERGLDFLDAGSRIYRCGLGVRPRGKQ